MLFKNAKFSFTDKLFYFKNMYLHMLFCSILEMTRRPCIEAEVLPPLVSLMVSPHTPVAVQACRALGNICFDNGMLSSQILLSQYFIHL